jgi:IS1 family transposase
MANVLPKDKQITVIAALAEGSSIRSIERMTGINRNTIMSLGVRVGQGALLHDKMRNLQCNLLQFDEVWGFIGKKQKHLRIDDDPTKGDVWTFCAIDAETKLVPAFKVGKRDHITANAFVSGVASRLRNRPQISTDGLRAYVEAVENAFGMNVDYGMIIKNYGTDQGDHHQERRYSAPAITFCEKREIIGRPNADLICTSHVERLNATTRLHMRRLTRLTHAFSKKLENFEAAVALHFAYYNLVRTHGSLK